MGPSSVIKIAGAIGILFLGLFLFPVMESNVDAWVTNVMPSLSMTSLGEFLVKALPYAGIVLFALAALWLIRGSVNE